MIKFTVFGNPIAQGRPKFFIRTKATGGQKFIGATDPKTSKSWKETVKWQAIENRFNILEGALVMVLTFYLQRPKSLPKKVIYHIKRPDLDNLTKAIKDALKGICYLDDSQIIEEHVYKHYAINKPRCEIEIKNMANNL